MPFQLIREDIVKFKSDVIVNTTNYNPVTGPGTDERIYTAAGKKELLKEREKIGVIEVGEARSTPALKLNAKYIIHTVGPRYNTGSKEEISLLKSCYKNSLNLAKELNAKSIAFPLISSGNLGFPKDLAIKTALSVFKEFLSNEDMDIYLLIFDKESFNVSTRLYPNIKSYIDDKTVDYINENSAKRGLTSHASGSIFTKLKRKPFESRMEECEALEESKPVLSERAPYNKVKSLDELLFEKNETFSEMLLRFITERNITNAECYKRANVSRKVFSKIICNPDYHPKKKTVIAFAIALKLNLDETTDLLKRAEYALSPANKFDIIIEYFIENNIYDIYNINLVLFEYGETCLGE